MTKIQQISKNITPFAGVFYANDEFNNFGVSKFIKYTRRFFERENVSIQY